MKKIFPLFTSISVLIIVLSLAYYLVIFLPSKEKTRQEDLIKKAHDTQLESCQMLIMDIDDLLAEIDKDYGAFITVMSDWLNYDVSDTKLAEQIELLVDKKEQRSYLYQRAIDKYNEKCFKESD